MNYIVCVHGKDHEVWVAVGVCTEVLITPGNIEETIRVKGGPKPLRLEHG